MPQSVLEGLSVLGHVAGHRLGADGKVNACPLMGRNVTEQTHRAEEDLHEYECKRVYISPPRTSFFSRLHS